MTAPAYVVALTTPRDAEALDRYREVAAASIAAYGGRYLVRGAVPDVLEGELPGSPLVVVVEFPSPERLREWYASPEYAEALEIRRTALDRVLIVADGVPA